MANGNGVSRGDRNRNARPGRLRELVPLENAMVGIDLADKKQTVVVSDHDSKVLARKTFRCRAWDLDAALDWAAEQAAAKGFAQVTVACEPTGHRWRVLGQLAERLVEGHRVLEFARTSDAAVHPLGRQGAVNRSEEDRTPGTAPVLVLDNPNAHAGRRGVSRPFVVVQTATDDRFQRRDGRPSRPR